MNYGAASCEWGIVLTINAHFVPSQGAEDYGFGVVGFVLAASDILARRGRLLGIVAYRRDDSLSTPSVKGTEVFGHLAVEVSFNFEMAQTDVTAAFSLAIEKLSLAQGRAQRLAITYHQTNTLLKYMASDAPFLITHHGPFAEHVRDLFGMDFATHAFQGGRGKVDHLINSQAAGLRILRSRPQGIALELSQVQRMALINAGVASSRIHIVPPPIEDFRRPSGSNAVNALSPEHCSGSLHVVSAAARIDEFKNLSALALALNDCVSEGVSVRVSLFVGSCSQDAERKELCAQLSPAVRERSLIAPRLPHGRLLEELRRMSGNAVFVFPSKYETFGITPWEAMMCGLLTTAIDEAQHVGVSSYLTPDERFAKQPGGLARYLRDLSRMDDLAVRGARQRARLLASKPTEQFALGVELAAMQSLQSLEYRLVNCTGERTAKRPTTRQEA